MVLQTQAQQFQQFLFRLPRQLVFLADHQSTILHDRPIPASAIVPVAMATSARSFQPRLPHQRAFQIEHQLRYQPFPTSTLLHVAMVLQTQSQQSQLRRTRSLAFQADQKILKNPSPASVLLHVAMVFQTRQSRTRPIQQRVFQADLLLLPWLSSVIVFLHVPILKERQ